MEGLVPGSLGSKGSLTYLYNIPTEATVSGDNGSGNGEFLRCRKTCKPGYMDICPWPNNTGGLLPVVW